VPFALFAIALTALVVALARPATTVRTPRREGTVVVALDVSNSMRATDVKPSRIEVAKRQAQAFVKRLPAPVRVAVVAFGDGAVQVQAPTLSRAEVKTAIDHVSVGGGTSLGQGLLTSLNTIAGKPVTFDEEALQRDDGQVDVGYFGSATIVSFTDGENTSRPDPLSVAQVASIAGVHVHAIGVGTEAGTVLKVNGFSIATALDSELLKRVATITDGSYHPATDESALGAVVRTVDLRFKLVTQHTEVTAIFAAGAVVLLLAGSLLSLRWLGRVV
jgi:Ca-activated chloride channel family protein